MGLINLGAGLSAMGASIASTAGQMGLEAQKQALEQQNMQLASGLAEGRETRLAGVTAGYAGQLESQKETGAVKLAQTTTELGVKAHAQEAQDAADLAEKLGSDPGYIAAQKALNSTDPAKMAQASDLLQQAALAKVQTAAAQKVMSARQDIIDAQNSGDTDQLAKAQQTFTTLMTDPAAASAMRTAAVANARVNEDAASRAEVELNAATAKLQDPNISGDPQARASLEANVKNLSNRVKMLNKAADDARSQANSLFGGNVMPSPTAPATTGGAPDLSKYLKAPGATNAPGLINTPPQ